MDPERRNQRILIALAWLLTLTGMVVGAFAHFAAGTKMQPPFEGERVFISLLAPVLAVLLALIVCLERPRSGAKPQAPLSALAALILSLLVIAGMVFTWLRR